MDDCGLPQQDGAYRHDQEQGNEHKRDVRRACQYDHNGYRSRTCDHRRAQGNEGHILWLSRRYLGLLDALPSRPGSVSFIEHHYADDEQEQPSRDHKSVYRHGEVVQHSLAYQREDDQERCREQHRVTHGLPLASSVHRPRHHEVYRHDPERIDDDEHGDEYQQEFL